MLQEVRKKSIPDEISLQSVLYLYTGFRGATTDKWTNPDVTAGIIVGSVSAGLLMVTGLFLLTAHCLKTRALERRVKAYDTSAGDKKTETENQEGQSRQHLGVPGVVDIPGQ